MIFRFFRRWAADSASLQASATTDWLRELNR